MLRVHERCVCGRPRRRLRANAGAVTRGVLTLAGGGSSALLRSVSAVPVAMVAGIIAVEYYVFCSQYLVPAMARGGESPLGSIVSLLEAALFHFLLGCLLVAYAKVVLTGASVYWPSRWRRGSGPHLASNALRCDPDPGYVTPQVVDRIRDAIQRAVEEGGVDSLRKSGGALMPPCRRCKQPKPFRAHHCSFCNKCVLKMGASRR